MHDTPSIESSPSRAARLIAGAMLLLAALIVPLAHASPSYASTHGAGEYVGSHWHGNYIENGEYVYCLDYHLSWDDGASPTWSGTVTSYRSLSPDQLAGIAAAVTWLGQTADPLEARAVADAIWFVTDSVVPAGATAGRAQEVIDWIAAWIAAPSSGSVAMTVASTGPRDGVLTIDSTSPGDPVTGTIALTGGVFADTGAATMSGVFEAGQSFAVRAAPSSGVRYRIAAAFSGTSNLSTYDPSIGIHVYGPDLQTMTGPAPGAIIPMTGAALETQDRDPVLMSTRTVASAPAGTGIRDTATIDDRDAALDLTGWTIGFDLYEFPSDGGLTPLCTPETLVFSSSEVSIAGAGEFESDAYPSTRPGTYGWIATLYDPGHAPQVVGVCGDPAETVLVESVLAITGDPSDAIGLTLAGGLALGGAGFAAAAANERRRR